MSFLCHSADSTGTTTCYSGHGETTAIEQHGCAAGGGNHVIALDRISLHNAYFPEMRLNLLGFGRTNWTYTTPVSAPATTLIHEQLMFHPHTPPVFFTFVPVFDGKNKKKFPFVKILFSFYPPPFEM